MEPGVGPESLPTQIFNERLQKISSFNRVFLKVQSELCEISGGRLS